MSPEFRPDSLAPVDVSPAVARRIRSLGRHALRRQADLPAPLRGLALAWDGWLEPALLLCTVLVYLGWALAHVVRIT